MRAPKLAGPMMAVVHPRMLGGEVDEGEVQQQQVLFGAAAQRLVERLSEREWLVGDSLTAADVTAAPVVWRVQSAGIFELSEDLAGRLENWKARVLAYDGVGRVGAGS